MMIMNASILLISMPSMNPKDDWNLYHFIKLLPLQVIRIHFRKQLTKTDLQNQTAGVLKVKLSSMEIFL